MFYNMRATAEGYRIVKFDSLLNIEGIYHIRHWRGRFYCDCPAANRESCRHREMVPIFCKHRAVDSGKFYCYDNETWLPAIEFLL